MNALTMEMHHELEAAFDAFAADDAQHVAIVTGAGPRAFSAGSDLRDAVERGGFDLPGAYPKHGYAASPSGSTWTSRSSPP